MAFATGTDPLSNERQRCGPLLHAWSDDGVSWTISESALDAPSSTSVLMGLPSLTVADGNLLLAVTYIDHVELLSRPADASVSTWTDPVRLTRYDAGGGVAPLIGPSLNCDPDAATPLVMIGLAWWDDRSLVRAWSSDGAVWDSDPSDWLDATAYSGSDLHHVDALRVTESDDLVLYYSVGDGTIGAAATLPTWEGTAPRGCIASVGDGGGPAPSPARAIEATVREGAGAAAASVSAGCGCATARPPGLVAAGAWTVLAALGLLRARTRR
jgi:hypothetical protein